MRPVIEGLIACCSAAQTNRSNGRVLGLEGCTISDWHKGYRCRCLLLLLPLLMLAWIHLCTVPWLGWLDDWDDPTHANRGEHCLDDYWREHSGEAFWGNSRDLDDGGAGSQMSISS